MSKIKNGGLDQYDKVQSLNGIGGERVNDLCITNFVRMRTFGASFRHETVDPLTELRIDSGP